MFKKWIAKIKARKAFNVFKSYIKASKDYDTKWISIVDKGCADYNPRFEGQSYIHLHCENKDASNDLYIRMPKDMDETSWISTLQIDICAYKAGFTIKHQKPSLKKD